MLVGRDFLRAHALILDFGADTVSVRGGDDSLSVIVRSFPPDPVYKPSQSSPVEQMGSIAISRIVTESALGMTVTPDVLEPTGDRSAVSCPIDKPPVNGAALHEAEGEVLKRLDIDGWNQITKEVKDRLHNFSYWIGRVSRDWRWVPVEVLRSIVGCLAWCPIEDQDKLMDTLHR